MIETNIVRSELQPKESCPFCKGKAFVFETSAWDEHHCDEVDYTYHCGCDTDMCHGDGEMIDVSPYATIEEAIEAWDTRV